LSGWRAERPRRQGDRPRRERRPSGLRARPPVLATVRRFSHLPAIGTQTQGFCPVRIRVPAGARETRR